MSGAPGRESGQASFTWSDYIERLVEERGSLARVAQLLAERRGYSEDTQSVERGLRRLRTRGSLDGGVWGERVLRHLGLPDEVAARMRWMGQYHTRFTDLPTSLCEELLRPWARPPLTQTPARIWVFLARTSIALRQRLDPEPELIQARLLASRAEPAARIELALVESYVWHHSDRARADAALEHARLLLADPDARSRIEAVDHACLFARAIDQLAYPLNRPRGGALPDHAAALELYASIPGDGPPFARCRRENGMGWSRLSLGDPQAAARHARASAEAAGDAGSLRMRAMALNLLAATNDPDSNRARARAKQIAEHLEDEVLRVRFR